MAAGRAADGTDFSQDLFSAPAERCRRFTRWVLERVDPAAPLRILDIGCGSGAQIFDLARVLPNAIFTGVDLSAPNIEAAARRARELELGARASFVACDYLDFRAAAAHDLTVSYSTLQLIPGDSGRLFRKIAGELVDGGLFMNVMPYECLYNRCLLGVRGVFAALRSPLLDALVFRAAKAVHGGRFDDGMLRERVGYMYQRLERLDGPALRELMAHYCSLELDGEAYEAQASLAQAKHRLLVFRKRASVP